MEKPEIRTASGCVVRAIGWVLGLSISISSQAFDAKSTSSDVKIPMGSDILIVPVGMPNVIGDVSDQGMQEQFASDVAQGLQGCGFKTVVSKEVVSRDSKMWPKDNESLSAKYSAGKPQKFLLETRVHSVEVVKALLFTEVCITGAVKQYSTDGPSYQRTYSAWNSKKSTFESGTCSQKLEHYSAEDPERESELKVKSSKVIAEVAGKIATKLCEDNN